jgi:hypothetical protein
MDERAPDYLQPRVGWRVWTAVEAEGCLRLRSLLYETIWTPGEAAIASCRRPLAMLPWSRLPLHEPPNLDCVCGLYAVATPAQAVAYLRAQADRSPRPVQRILGQVALWGRVIEGPWGWRAGRAYPERLFVPPVAGGLVGRVVRRAPSRQTVATALEAYRVPVELADALRLEDGVTVPL